MGDEPTAILLLSCPDQPGLVAAVADFVFANGGNILHADQHTDSQAGIFFQRVEFGLDGFALTRPQLRSAVEALASPFGMDVEVRFSDTRPNLALLMSKDPNCTYDLLARWRTGELDAAIPLIIANHPDHAQIAGHFGVEYHHLPVTPETRARQEAQIANLLERHRIDLVVLTRYMQILSADFVARFPNRIINIHHSFLPAFAGRRPHHQAYERGVKIIGATAHYVTADLDAGPIIAQDVIHVTHRDSVDDLVRKSRDLEKIVLARVVRAHLGHRILVYGNKTVVFD